VHFVVAQCVGFAVVQYTLFTVVQYVYFAVLQYAFHYTILGKQYSSPYIIKHVL